MAVKNKPFKRFTFADGFFCYARGYSKQELEREIMGHGPLIRVEPASAATDSLFPERQSNGNTL